MFGKRRTVGVLGYKVYNAKCKSKHFDYWDMKFVTKAHVSHMYSECNFAPTQVRSPQTST